jgi:uncharacterized protein
MKHPVWITLLLSLTGGLVFSFLHIPLAWLLGPMTSVLIWREAFGREASWPVGLRNGGLAMLGYMMGGTFTAKVAVQIAGQLPSMAAATVLTVGFAMALGWLTARRTGIGLASGLIGSIPGGLSQMVALSGEVRNADMTVVTFMQTIRLMAVIFIVPFLAVHGLADGGGSGQPTAPTAAIVTSAEAETGSTLPRTHGSSLKYEASPADSTEPPAAPRDSVESASSSLWLSSNALWYVLAVGLSIWLAPLLRLPTPYMLGPMLATALLCVSGLEEPRLPNLAIIGAQILIGAHMGTGTRLSSLANWRKLLPYSVAGGIGIVLFSLGVGYVLTLWHPMSFVTAFLGASPGGMTEMGLTGAAVHADLSIIVAYQMFRILFILFIVPYILKGLLRALPRPDLTQPRKDLDR